MKKILLGLSGALMTVGAAWVVAQENLPPADAKPMTKPTLEEQYSYAIGLDMGTCNFVDVIRRLDHGEPHGWHSGRAYRR